MFKDIELVFDKSYFLFEKIPILMLFLVVILIIIITVILVRKELKKL